MGASAVWTDSPRHSRVNELVSWKSPGFIPNLALAPLTIAVPVTVPLSLSLTVSLALTVPVSMVPLPLSVSISITLTLPLPFTLPIAITITLSVPPAVLGLGPLTVSTIVQTVEFTIPVTVLVFV
ncbi:unnamed protein product [Rhizoctonia solani]|uniref:Uncharacterized protein n=1 Tax=Rhizoctonia solani TaxID=456999 RepID=A0A8H3GXF8_9AGAM|nr:unnamed protein product [Rhizoctonia solani]